MVLGIALVFVFLTRWPVARTHPLDTDELGFLRQITVHWFPMHHTLFQTLGRMLGSLCGDPYRGFILLDMLCSAGALASLWWWLRALVPPTTAAAATLLLGVGPVFWGYGAMAGNYTAIVLVGSFLLGVAVRGRVNPRTWHPTAAAIVLAIGTGYRPDIGTFWLPVYFVILWQQRWRIAIHSLIFFTILNVTWLAAMLYDVGGWTRYRAATAEFAYEAGVLNSVWRLGILDAPVRYAVKLSMALLWTIGPASLFVPRGLVRLWKLENGRFIVLLMALSTIPALAFHLLVHFGVPGYSFHYLPSLIALGALGIGRTQPGEEEVVAPNVVRDDRAVPRLVGIATLLAGLFLFYPTDYNAPGWRGDFDASFCRFTRIGLLTPPRLAPSQWRTANSRISKGLPIRAPAASERHF
jgi:hypothetical protein